MLVYVAITISLLLTLIAGIPYLNFLKKRLYGQFIRKDGPSSHTKKSGTPTMGGLIIVLPSIFTVLLCLVMKAGSIETPALISIFCFIAFSFLGFKDDINKVLKKRNKGLSGWSKLAFQSLIALIPALYLTFTGKTDVSIFNLININLGFLYAVFAVFIIVGTSNAVNLTDGLDGLASGTSFFALIAFTFIFILKGIPQMAIVSAAIAGSCAGFLYFNKHPAKMFMGDTGSLALGGVIGTLAVLGKLELWLIIIGGVFVIETLSVILQVISFKATGKRIFKMSPLHHHFELSGWNEQQVVYLFWTTGIVLSLVACFLIYTASTRIV